MNAIIPEAIEAYALAHSEPASGLSKELETYTKRNCELSQMLVGGLEAALLKMLVRLNNVHRILEVGLYTGYSALAMAEALPEDGELISCDINSETAAIARSFFERSPHGSKIHVHLGHALKTLDALPPERLFDLVFIDADKENYIAYYERTLPLLRPGGLLVADNVLWSGNVLDPRQESDHAIVAFNQRVQNDDRVDNVLLTVRDGVMLARKK
jgi:caffeoyl-CoA O-methyltransferase